MSLSTFFGLSVEAAIATILHFPAFFPFFLSFTVTAPVGPHAALSPDGRNFSDDVPRHLPMALTVLSWLATHGLTV